MVNKSNRTWEGATSRLAVASRPFIKFLRAVLPALFIVLISGCSRPSDGSGASIAETITLKDLKGNAVDLRQYEGKIIFLNLWATWCAPCVREMPSIDRASKTLRDDNIVFLFASDEAAERIEKFGKDKNFSVPLVQIENMAALNVQALPTTLILDGNGHVVHSEVGYRLWDSPESIAMIRKFIAQP